MKTLLPSKASSAALATAVVFAALVPLSAIAVVEPQPTAEDSRIGVVIYSPNDVTRIRVRRGTVTRVTLESDEHIATANPGLSSRCDNDDDEWCIHADKGANELIVRPKDQAQHNNLEVRTDKRNYSIEFVVLPDESSSTATNAVRFAKKPGAAATLPFFRVSFTYPAPPRAVNDRARAAASVLEAMDGDARTSAVPPAIGPSPVERLNEEPLQIRNSQYTMQVLEHGEDAAPSLVFDDGRFTYLEFRGAREIPAVFANDAAGQPIRVNWHMQPPYLVVERTARSFTLRLGDAVAGVFNEHFDPVGIDTPSNTTSAFVRREAKEAEAGKDTDK